MSTHSVYNDRGRCSRTGSELISICLARRFSWRGSRPSRLVLLDTHENRAWTVGRMPYISDTRWRGRKFLALQKMFFRSRHITASTAFDQAYRMGRLHIFAEFFRPHFWWCHSIGSRHVKLAVAKAHEIFSLLASFCVMPFLASSGRICHGSIHVSLCSAHLRLPCNRPRVCSHGDDPSYKNCMPINVDAQTRAVRSMR